MSRAEINALPFEDYFASDHLMALQVVFQSLLSFNASFNI